MSNNFTRLIFCTYVLFYFIYIKLLLYLKRMCEYFMNKDECKGVSFSKKNITKQYDKILIILKNKHNTNN
jgi:hypothetical protein